MIQCQVLLLVSFHLSFLGDVSYVTLPMWRFYVTRGTSPFNMFTLQGEFKLGFITLLPAIAIIILLLCKVNAVVSLGLSAICAGAVSFFYQGATLQSIIRVAYNGYSTSIEEGILQTILNRGGMSSMLQYVAIICFAVGMGGMLDRLGVLGNLLNAIVNHINR